jgi:NAD(P)H-dependent FMN reductase
MPQPKILIILGSVREGRVGEGISKWVKKVADSHPVGMEYELMDLKNFNFGNYNDARPASIIKMGEYGSDLANQWAEKIHDAHGFVIVTPEYNHSFPGSLKNALDMVYGPWNNKPVAFVSYGTGAGGSRAVEQLRLIAAELQMADIRLATHIVNYYQDQLDANGAPKNPQYTQSLEAELDQLSWWTKALKAARDAA